jgi:hypothetical protein
VIVQVPVETPNMMPVVEPMSAIEELELAQTPPAAASVNVTVPPTETVLGPDIAGGPAFTVTG